MVDGWVSKAGEMERWRCIAYMSVIVSSGLEDCSKLPACGVKLMLAGNVHCRICKLPAPVPPSWTSLGVGFTCLERVYNTAEMAVVLDETGLLKSHVLDALLTTLSRLAS